MQETKYCSQFSSKCVDVVLKIEIIVEPDAKIYILRHFLHARALGRSNIAR